MKYLMICEKSSLMQDVRSCYMHHKSEIEKKVGDIDFTALSGHVCTNYEPTDYEAWADEKWADIDYPMIPGKWGIKVIDTPKARSIVKDIKGKVRNYDGIIVGTDSDVEGYGIYYLLEQYLGIEDMKALRFVEHSLTDGELLQSFLTMTDYHNDPTHVRFTKSFLLRSRGDWLYGMNGTRMLSVKMDNLFTVGRVKSVVIKIVYDNSMAISNFVPKHYKILEAKYDGFKAFYTEDGTSPYQFDMDAEIPDVSTVGVVKSKETKKTFTHAPGLYDLSAIQTEAGQSFGYTPEETLNIIQSLYEKHKLISYPRTQCRYVSTEKAQEFTTFLGNMDVFSDLAEVIGNTKLTDLSVILKDKQVVNDAEVLKESHDALLPTSTRPDLSKLNDDEIRVCHMIYKRLLAQFLPKLAEEKTKLSIMHDDKEFIAKGKIVIDQGWRVLYNASRDNVIPNVSEGERLNAKEIATCEKVTSPPKRLNQATLVHAMEHVDSLIEDKELKKSLADSKGIGTSATRATIIKDVISRGYVDDKKDGLHISRIGVAYVDSMKDLEIISPVFAAVMDTKIKKIQRGEAEYDDVYNDMIENLHNMCHQIDGMPSKYVALDVECPKCETPLTAKKYEYICPSCGFKVSRSIAGKDIDEDTLDLLLSGVKTPQYTFKKKDGTTFKARLKMVDDDVQFDFSSGVTCPWCGKKDITLNRGGVFCDCGLKVFRKMGGHEFTDKELKKLVKIGRLDDVSGFVSKKSGKEFTASVILTEDGTKFDFSD